MEEYVQRISHSPVDGIDHDAVSFWPPSLLVVFPFGTDLLRYYISAREGGEEIFYEMMRYSSPWDKVDGRRSTTEDRA